MVQAHTYRISSRFKTNVISRLVSRRFAFRRSWLSLQTPFRLLLVATPNPRRSFRCRVLPRNSVRISQVARAARRRTTSIQTSACHGRFPRTSSRCARRQNVGQALRFSTISICERKLITARRGTNTRRLSSRKSRRCSMSHAYIFVVIVR